MYHVEPRRCPFSHTADSPTPIDRLLHRMEEKTSKQLPYGFIRIDTGCCGLLATGAYGTDQQLGIGHWLLLGNNMVAILNTLDW